ncbi:cationic amino acid transporter 2 isoform X1 [Phymastichus coffea]|uniref:cationic amino acid transporter 2 isoform X1 n=1 Tax=Phymastichus coffea TaxID=108790 RepID=UPI00273AC7D8|nr:cationic amino acid transporter 2 isoform X1 [Phymastichus coffea]XP_058792723.1 cationic amino acid transporter 2 isoform X1 [Phymastichus coffea]
MKLEFMDREKGLELFGKLIRTKDVENLQGEQARAGGPGRGRGAAGGGAEAGSKQKLQKCLTTLDLTSLGVGSCVGTGMYLVAGMVARSVAGPGVVVSFIIAAIASIFSGACYAEFGVRVPHTTGSAYMYSYVTVGELIAFIIGWNMILEYLIGTSACAAALSACLDALADGAVSEAIGSVFGTFFGRPPDLVAFVITLLMMVLMVAGVRKSLVFNNVLNTLNLAVWVFIMAAGMFYVDSSNWSEHKGFLPYGWSGVFTGAATCFYAFIGFDIIATTGEEATNPKRSIPLAIVSSLVIILVAYVTSSMVLTLIVPYDEVDQDSALVEMFGQVGAYKCKYIVAVGALAGLTVSMFGSMFPMPRIVYAMAQDGLIFRSLSQVWPMTGTPALATVTSGLCAAVAALLIQLEVLVEMMSIGTLLAYTLVSTCVLILRYQPHTTNLVELLPQSLRTPCRSPSRETAAPTTYGKELRPDQLATALNSAQAQADLGVCSNGQRIMVRRVRRANSSSPESDDTYGGDEEEIGLGKDDQYLVSDRTENKFYGSVHAAAAGSSCGSAHQYAAHTPIIGPPLGYLQRKLQEAQYLCPAIFPWVDRGPATEESGRAVMKLVGLLYILIFAFDLIVVCAMGSMGGFTKFLLFVLFCGIVGVLLVISRKPQSRNTFMFMTPGLPFVPAIAVTVNVYLIFKLSILTLVRFTLWMVLGFAMYFKYGIKNSSLERGGADREAGAAGAAEAAEPSGGTIELKVTDVNRAQAAASSSSPYAASDRSIYEGEQLDAFGQPVFGSTSFGGAAAATGSSSLFVAQDSFPTWDD